MSYSTMKFNGRNLNAVIEHANKIGNKFKSKPKKHLSDYSGAKINFATFHDMGMAFANADKAHFYKCAFDGYVDYSTFHDAVFENCVFNNYAHVYGANFDGAQFIHCTFYNTSFYNCNFDNVIFDKALTLIDTHTYISNCSCNNAELPSMVCPESGEFVGYKKVYLPDYKQYGVAKLVIPADSKRSSGLGKMCRCSNAYVEELYDKHMKPVGNLTVGRSPYVGAALYVKNNSIYADGFDECRINNNASGIHFFCDLEDALFYEP